MLPHASGEVLYCSAGISSLSVSKQTAVRGTPFPDLGSYLKDEGDLSSLRISQALLRVPPALRLFDELFSERPKILGLYLASMLTVPRLV